MKQASKAKRTRTETHTTKLATYGNATCRRRKSASRLRLLTNPRAEGDGRPEEAKNGRRARSDHV